MQVNVGLAMLIYAISAYLHASVGLVGPKVALLTKLLETVGGLSAPWIVGADWNLIPADIEERAKMAAGVLLNPQDVTCGARELVFFCVRCSLVFFC